MTKSIRNVDGPHLCFDHHLVCFTKMWIFFYFIFYETYPYSSIDKKRTKGFVFFFVFF